MIRLKFWGVRGSIPTPGPATVKTGGNTSCIEVRCDDKLIIFDGGTGLRALGEMLLKEAPITASMFFSHVHWDHIQGFPFFTPALAPGNHFDLYGGVNVTATLAETLSGQMNFPNFPLTLEQMAANMVFHQFDDGQTVDLGSGEIRWQVRLGTIRDIAPIPLPIKLGTPNVGGPLVTASGLIFIGAAMDDYLRAFDIESGEELWKARLPAGGQATPMSFVLPLP